MKEVDLSKIKTVFLDIGGVLLTNGWGQESRQKATQIFDFDYYEMSVLHRSICKDFETGIISLDVYLDMVIFHCPRDFTKAAFKEFMFSESVALPNFLAWIKKWKKQTKLPVYAINNESKELNEYRINTFHLQEVFDGFFSSCYMGFCKPDPRIFDMALQITQTSASECIYFDDRIELVRAAEKLGIPSILHQSFETSKAILEKLL